MGFMFGWKYQKALIKHCLNDCNSFYYLVHPADLTGPGDIDSNRVTRFERMGTSLEEKLSRFEECIKLIVESGRTIVTMRELSDVSFGPARCERRRLDANAGTVL